MKLYHGSNIEVRKPEIRPSKFTKDFGVGFYCTRFKRQAKRWACRKTPSVISEYEFIRKSELSVKVFSNMTDEWLDFIVSCRRGYTTEESLSSLKFLSSQTVDSHARKRT